MQIAALFFVREGRGKRPLNNVVPTGAVLVSPVGTCYAASIGTRVVAYCESFRDFGYNRIDQGLDGSKWER